MKPMTRCLDCGYPLVEGGMPESCPKCLKKQRDHYRVEFEHILACLETPETIAFEKADAFLAKLTGRGCARLDEPAVRYHLALLVKEMAKTTMAPPAGPGPTKTRAERPHLELRATEDEHWTVDYAMFGRAALSPKLTRAERDKMILEYVTYLASRNQAATIRLWPYDPLDELGKDQKDHKET